MRYFYLFLVGVFLGGCGTADKVEEEVVELLELPPPNSGTSNYSVSFKKVSEESKNPDITLKSNDVYKKMTLSTSKIVNLNLSSPSDIYVLFTNTKDSGTNSENRDSSFGKRGVAGGIGSYNEVLKFRKNLKSYFKSDRNLTKQSFKRLNKEVGDSRRFYIDLRGYRFTDTTLRMTRKVHTEFGDKTLSIYVSNDSFDDGNCYKRYCVTQEMVDTLADKFLRTGEDNDIYDWETNIFGEEWFNKAVLKNGNLITATDEIVILLTDIDGDNNAQSGAIGYFWAKDAFIISKVQ